MSSDANNSIAVATSIEKSTIMETNGEHTSHSKATRDTANRIVIDFNEIVKLDHVIHR